MVSKDRSTEAQAKMKSNLVFSKIRISKEGAFKSYPPASAHIALHEGRRVEVGKNFIFSHCLKTISL